MGAAEVPVWVWMIYLTQVVAITPIVLKVRRGR